MPLGRLGIRSWCCPALALGLLLAGDGAGRTATVVLAPHSIHVLEAPLQ